MSYMQIDIPSPLRSAGNKRPRSPTSPSPAPPTQERPSKRVALAPGSAGRTPSPLLGHVNQQPATLPIQPPSTFTDRISEDWVDKTNGLKLDSPLFGTGHSGSLLLPETGNWDYTDSEEVGRMEDDSMTVETDGNSIVTNGSWAFPSTAEHTTSRSPLHLPHVPDTYSSPMYSTARQSTPVHAAAAAQSDIHIHVHPATPANRGPQRNDNSPMLASPSNPAIWGPFTPARKPRVTMGPRPDCEKCKNGVKGHWMHID